MAAERDPRAGDLHGELRASRGAQGAVFGQEQIAGLQRARILSGLFAVVAEQGAANVTVADIVLRAGVSRRTFYELFADREDCLVAAFGDALEVAAARVLPSVRAQRTWVAQLRAGMGAFLRFLGDEPKLAKLLVCESLSGGSALLECRTRTVAALAAFVDQGRGEGGFGAQLAMLQAEGSVGGVLAILQNLLVADYRDSYMELLGPLTAMVVMPYLGPARARQEFERETEIETVRVHEPSLLFDPLKAAGMRLTYRTVRVLVAVGQEPGASNRRIGDMAEIGDQGQISKLLRRLAHAELIENHGMAPGQGAPNAWRLTAAGRQLTDRIGAHVGQASFTSNEQTARGGNS